MKNIFLFLLYCIPVLISSCGKDEVEPYDHPYVHIQVNNLDSITVNSNRRDIVPYYIYLSSKPLQKDLQVDYSIITGDGLKQGIDFNVITTESPMTFPVGIYQRPVQIQWLSHVVDPGKDNTLTIELEGNDQNISTGMPGPDSFQKSLVITKINP